MAKLSVRVVMISTSVLFTAVVLKLCVPIIMEFAFSEAVLAWLRPPYLYVVINGIIITIVASSKLQSRKVVVVSDLLPEAVVAYPAPIKVSADYAAVYDGVVDEKSGQEVEVQPEFAYGYEVVAYPAPIKVSADYAAVYDGIVDEKSGQEVEVLPEFAYGYDEVVVKGEDFDVDHGRVEDGIVAEMESAETTALALNATEEDVVAGGEDEVAVLTSLPPQQNSTTTEYLVASHERPPVSGRIGQRKGVKSTSEGGRTLRVSKPKRHETLENTWKTITEGRPIPLARHLKKSDTWETHNRVGHLQEVLHHDQTMLKSETFNDRSTTPVENRPGPVKLRRDPSGSGKLKREPSPSQDELNRRVEAFIKKFNEEMRLQRQESLNQYTEMINRGAH